ncbi:Enoyl-[acyl-carrier-protein] reductase [NADH] [hydrothermal vent metagenome]|uniref:Enoyl-[acyl-carrier-protein] reductase [NADH] n=1 Tax=hydrothermal vent metagenome TaxID=652676 RepID=A0A3B1BG33_9ZZZZ
MSYLGFEGKTYLVFGVANRKSVAYFIANIIRREGGNVIFSVLNEEKKREVEKLFPDSQAHICDVSKQESIEKMAEDVGSAHHVIHGVVHSIAYANYSEGIKPFHETKKEDFMEALDISCFSLMAISNALKPVLDKKASVVTISISTTTMAASNYGYMGPVKAALDSALSFLAKSFSEFSEIRFNAVAPGLLKTSASAGIPGYVDSYLYAEAMTLRKKAVNTEEAANVAVFLLSDASSGVTARKIVVDAGMSVNYFDQDMIVRALKR